MTFLVDYNLDGYALIFLGILAKRGWLEFQCVQFVTFREAELSMESSDRDEKSINIDFLPFSRLVFIC